MFQAQLVCCNQYWNLQQLRWFCSKLLLLLKVSYLAFESILVFLCLQGEVGRKHLQGSFCFCSSLDTLSIVSASLLNSFITTSAMKELSALPFLVFYGIFYVHSDTTSSMFVPVFITETISWYLHVLQ